MATDRRAEVTWKGELFTGSGTITKVTSGAFGPLDVSWPRARRSPTGAPAPRS